MAHSSSFGMSTHLIHGAHEAYPSRNVSPAIYQTSTFRISPEEGAEFAAAVQPPHFYTRLGNPNTCQVEHLLQQLEGSEAALVVGSGMGMS
jgi:cystathionine beta-lyase/cystathionine gamma-synthase